MNGGTLKDRIVRHLSSLRGLPLWACGRASDLFWLEFGEKRLATSVRGGTREVGEYALHIQCRWEIRGPEGAVVVASDSGAINDRLVEFQAAKLPAEVLDFRVDDHGGIQIQLAGNHTVSITPDDSDQEQWRLLQPGQATPHVVLEGSHLVET